MNFVFQSYIPSDFKGQPILLSGDDSKAQPGVEYLVINSDVVYEIRFQYRTSPFNDVKIFDNRIAVGHHEYFYLYDVENKTLLFKLKMEDYFGHVCFNDNYIYVADGCTISCVSIGGVVLWRTENLAIDGVVINDFTDDKIFGEGEYDPPGGWEPFVLDIKTGFKL